MNDMPGTTATRAQERPRDGFARATLIGRLTSDPVSRRTRAGDITTLRLAVNETADPSFFDIVLWDKLGQIAGTHLSTGARVLVDGRLQQRHWEDAGGSKHERVELVAETLRFLSGVGDEQR